MRCIGYNTGVDMKSKLSVLMAILIGFYTILPVWLCGLCDMVVFIPESSSVVCTDSQEMTNCCVVIENSECSPCDNSEGSSCPIESSTETNCPLADDFCCCCSCDLTDPDVIVPLIKQTHYEFTSAPSHIENPFAALFAGMLDVRSSRPPGVNPTIAIAVLRL